jgi:F-type H+-transporting ATPase subunit b
MMQRVGLIALCAVFAAALAWGADDLGDAAPDHSDDEAGHGGAGVFHFDPGLQLWTLVTFVALLWLLWKFAFPPISRALEERETTIRGAVEEAEQRRREAEELQRDYKKRLDEAHDETRRILDEGRRLAETTRQEITDKARAESHEILERAKGEIDHMKLKGVEELRETVAHMSVEIASQVLRAEIDEDAHRKLVDDLVAELKDRHGTRTGRQ